MIIMLMMIVTIMTVMIIDINANDFAVNYIKSL